MQGDLSINGIDATDLEALDCLIRVAGHTSISGNAWLANLDGLSQLNAVGWTFVIYSNNALADLDGLASLTSVGLGADQAGNQPGTGRLVISGNNALSNLNGLSQLSHLDGKLEISNNPNLPTCQAIRIKKQLEDQGWNREAVICGNLADDCGFEPCLENEQQLSSVTAY